MKKIFSTAIIALAAFATLVSCSSLMEKDIDFAQDNEVKFTTDVRAFNTKADIIAGFKDGDQVGIIAGEPINAMNVNYTVSGNSLTSETPIHWAEGQTAESEFIAYFPYIQGFNTYDAMTFSVKEDQSDPENYRLSDFLVADEDGRPGESVKLTFYHFFSRVDISLDEELEGKVASVSFANVASSMSNRGDAVAEQTSTIKAIRLASSGAGESGTVWSLILVPQEASPVLVVTTTAGETLSYNLGKKTAFESGKRYEATLSLGEGGSLAADFVIRVFDWIWGGSAGFEPYIPRWSVGGSFSNYSPAYDLTRNEEGVYVSNPFTLSAGAEFKFFLDGKSVTNIGVSETAGDLAVGEWADAAYGGYYFSVAEEGYYRVVLDVANMKVRLVPGYDWSVSMAFLTEANRWEESQVKMDYQGGLTWTVTRLYLPPRSRMCFQEYEYSYQLKRVLSESVIMTADGLAVCEAQPGTTYTLCEENEGYYLYYAAGGFVNITFDMAAGTVSFALDKDQQMNLAAVYAGLPDGTAVALEGVTVYAVSSRGVIVSDDGKQGLLVVCGNDPSSLPAVGDVITVSGSKYTVYDHPFLTGVEISVTGRNATLADVAYKDMTSLWDLAEFYSVSRPVMISGELSVSNGANENCYVITSNMTKFYFPLEEYLKYSGSSVTVSGWCLGFDNKDGVWNIVVTDIEGLEEKDHGDGSLEHPFDAVGATLYTKTLGVGNASTDKVYVQGSVVDIQSVFTASSPKAVFTLAERMDKTSTFIADNVGFLGDADWQFGNSNIGYWNDVVIYGNIVLAEGSAPSTVKGQAYIYSLNGKTSETVPEVTLSGDGTLENPYNVPAAVMFAQSLMNQESTVSDYVYVSGVIANVESSFSEDSYARFTMTETGSKEDQFIVGVEDTKYLGGIQWNEELDNIKQGDNVIVCMRIRGTASNFAWSFSDYGRYYPWLYYLNGVTKLYEPTIALDETSMHVVNAAREFKVGYYSDVKCEVSCDADWLTVLNFENFYYLRITTTDNPGTEERTATIKLYYEFGDIYAEAVLTIVQAGQDMPAPTEFEGEVLYEGLDFIHSGGQYHAFLGYLYQYPDVFTEKYQDWSSVPAGSTMRIYYVCDTRYEEHKIMVSTVDGGSENYYAYGNLDPSKTQVDIPLSETFLARLVSERGLLLAGCGYDLYAVSIIDAE